MSIASRRYVGMVAHDRTAKHVPLFVTMKESNTSSDEQSPDIDRSSSQTSDSGALLSEHGGNVVGLRGVLSAAALNG